MPPPATQNQTTNLFWKRSDGTGEVQRLTDSPNTQTPSSFHPSGKYLAYVERRPDTGTDIMILPLMGNEKKGGNQGALSHLPIQLHTKSGRRSHPTDVGWPTRRRSPGPGEVYVQSVPEGRR